MVLLLNFKNGLLHSNILICREIQANEAKDEGKMCAKTPHPKTPQYLIQEVQSHMIHGPCTDTRPSYP